MTFNPGDVITVDFPGVTGVKRRPAVVLYQLFITQLVLM